MKKPHILFVTEKYADANPTLISNNRHNLFGSLECSELATYSNFFFEENTNQINKRLIDFHKILNPDLVVVTLLPNNNFSNNPSYESLSLIAEKTPIVFIWYDSIQHWILEKIKQVESFSTLNVMLDNAFFIPNDKYIHLWTPQDIRIYNDPAIKREIDVSLVGSMNGYTDRTDGIKHLMTHTNFYIYRDGGQREKNLTPQNYAKIIQKSKISLSFSTTTDGKHQTKGRLWEITLCGAMLMEDINQGTGGWFTPYKDYVPFTSKEDLADKVSYYLSQPDKLTEIAYNGKRKSELHYSPKNWWTVVINKSLRRN